MQLLRSTIMTLLFAMATHAATECSQLLGLNAKYYQFPTFSYAPNVTAGQTPPYAPYLSRVESVIDYEFGGGGIGTVPGGTKHNDYVMVTWEGFYAAPANGTYRFNCISDDGCRILLDNQLILNNWAPQQPNGVMSDYVSLAHYTLYPLRVEYFNRFGGCAVHLQYSSDDLGIPLTLVPATELYSSQCNIAPFDNCQSNPCLNGATCIDGNGDFTCTCPNGFSGKRCQNVVTPTCQPFTAPKPSGSNTGTAIINSTPLIQSYMNDAFDVRDIGPFYAAYSLDGQTVLQINIAMYNTSATSPTVANSVALYYKGATVVLDTKGKTTVSNLSGKVTQSVQGSTQTFTTTNGFVLVATRVGTFYSIHATASASYSNFVRGLIGTLSGNANSDMTDMNGNIVTFPEFVSAWKVPVTQDLSLNPMATFSPLYRDTSINCNPGTNSNPTPTPTGTGTCDTNSLGRIVSVHQEGVETIMCFAYRNTEKTICSGGSYMPSNTCGDSCST